MTDRLIVGVSGKKRHGKDSWATPLIEALGLAHLAFADPLRNLVVRQDPIVYARGWSTRLSDGGTAATRWLNEAGRLLDATMSSGIPELEDEDLAKRFLLAQNPILFGQRTIRYTDLVDVVGYTAAKNADEVRRYLQVTGTEAGRQLVRDSLWVDLALAAAERAGHRVAFTDTRFPNEAAAVRAAGGLLVRVNRPGVVAADEHPSETALDDWTDWDLVVTNDGTLEDLQRHAMAFAESIRVAKAA